MCSNHKSKSEDLKRIISWEKSRSYIRTINQMGKKNIIHRSVPKELLQGMHKLEYKPLKIQRHYTNMELVNLSFQHNGLEGEALMNLTKEKLVCQDVIRKYKSFKSLKISQLMSK